MKSTKLLPSRDEVAIDDNHIALIGALVACSKPKSLLELGIGSGATTHALLEAMRYNGNEATLTCVDNFLDWDGKPPPGIFELPVQLVVQGEREFIEGCKDSFNFIVSDADHEHSHEWFISTLNLIDEDKGGIAVFHDVTSEAYPHLRRTVHIAEMYDMKHVVFNHSSRDDERCQRGLLVVFK